MCYSLFARRGVDTASPFSIAGCARIASCASLSSGNSFVSPAVMPHPKDGKSIDFFDVTFMVLF